MPDERRRELSAETAGRIEALCRRVAVGRGVDEAVRRELCGHMADKLAAYVEGREPVSEEDALLLVERHFGEPEAVGEGMRRVHIRAAVDTVARRLAAVFALSCLLELGRNLSTYVVWRQVDWTAAYHHLPPMNLPAGQWVPFVGLAVLPVMVVGAMWGILARWRRRVRRGERVWYADWSWWGVAAVAAIALVEEEWGRTIVVPSLEGWLRNYSHHAAAYAMLDQAMALMTALVWIWWCSSRPVRWSSWSVVAGFVGALAWLGWMAGRDWRMPPELWWAPEWWTRYVEWVLWWGGVAGASSYAWAVAWRTVTVVVALLLWWLVVVVRRGRDAATA
jgi:hypothetical protein